MSGSLVERARRAAEVAEAELAAVPNWIWDGAELPVPVQRIAEDFYGLLVQEQELSDAVTDRYVSGLLAADLQRIVVDRLEAARSPGRRRFTVAHELGHWVLHERSSVRSSVSSPRQPAAEPTEGLHPEFDWMANYPPDELEANQFAAAMLIPKRLIARARASTSDVDELAQRFLVSTWAMERRVAFLDALAAHEPANHESGLGVSRRLGGGPAL